jgi:hypothetical protein
VVDAATRKPARQSVLGFVVRPRRSYKVRLVSQGPEHEPQSVRLSAGGSLPWQSGPEERTRAENGQIVHWLGFDAPGGDRPIWSLRRWFSRVERLAARLEYADGRGDYEREVPIVISPGWSLAIWSLAVLLLLAVLPHVVQRLAPMEFAQSLLREAWQLLLSPATWAVLVGLAAVLWLAIAAIDRLHLYRQWRRLTREHAAQRGR